MVPDLRPSSPFSTGPTLFLAPSPTAWQARHLLNEVLPASASCATALEVANDAAMTNSVLRVSFFMGCSSSLPVGAGSFCHARLAMDKPSRAGQFHDDGSVFSAIF